MARITVEDCLDKVDNMFQLVLIAAKRSRQLSNGAPARVDWENDKPTVVALREIAEGETDATILDEVDPPVGLDDEDGLMDVPQAGAPETGTPDTRTMGTATVGAPPAPPVAEE